MPIMIDVEKDLFYQEGVEKGIEKGIQGMPELKFGIEGLKMIDRALEYVKLKGFDELKRIIRESADLSQMDASLKGL